MTPHQLLGRNVYLPSKNSELIQRIKFFRRTTESGIARVSVLCKPLSLCGVAHPCSAARSSSGLEAMSETCANWCEIWRANARGATSRRPRDLINHNRGMREFSSLYSLTKTPADRFISPSPASAKGSGRVLEAERARGALIRQRTKRPCLSFANGALIFFPLVLLFYFLLLFQEIFLSTFCAFSGFNFLV